MIFYDFNNNTHHSNSLTLTILDITRLKPESV